MSGGPEDRDKRASDPTPFIPSRNRSPRRSRLEWLHSLRRALEPVGLKGLEVQLAQMVEAEGNVKRYLREHNWHTDPERHLPEVLQSVPNALRSPTVVGLLHDLRLRAGPVGETLGDQLGLTYKVRDEGGRLADVPVIEQELSASQQDANMLLERCARAIKAPLLDHEDLYWRVVAAGVQGLIDQGKTSRFAHQKIGKKLGLSAENLRANLTRRRLQVLTKK